MRGGSRKRFVTLAASAGTFAGLRARAKAAPFELRCAAQLALDHPASVRLTQMWAAVERESGGRIRVSYFPNSQLGGDAAMFAQLRLGAIDFNVVTPGQLASVVPVADISFLGFAFDDAAEGLHVMDGPLGAYVRREAAARGLHLTGRMWDNGMNHVGSNTRPVRTPPDLRDFRIRVIESKILVDLFKSLGASPVPLSFSEVYSALETRLIDGEAAALVAIETSRFYEVNRYVSLTNHYWGGLWLAANADCWAHLPGDLRSLIESNGAAFAVRERKDAAALNAALADKLARRGIAVNRVDAVPFRRMLGSYYESWASAFGRTAWGFLEDGLGRKVTANG